MENNNFIITINREFGTGGREVAQKLGNLLGVKVYDKALLDALAEKFGMTEEEIEKAKSKKSNWWDDFYKQFGNAQKVNQKERVTSKEIFAAEEKILKEIAQRESCVIVGRAGFKIFKDHPKSMKVLLIADDEARVKRISETEALSRMPCSLWFSMGLVSSSGPCSSLVDVASSSKCWRNVGVICRKKSS